MQDRNGRRQVVPKVDLNGLDSDFLEEEVKKVVWDLRPGRGIRVG